ASAARRRTHPGGGAGGGKPMTFLHTTSGGAATITRDSTGFGDCAGMGARPSTINVRGRRASAAPAEAPGERDRAAKQRNPKTAPSREPRITRGAAIMMQTSPSKANRIATAAHMTRDRKVARATPFSEGP